MTAPRSKSLPPLLLRDLSTGPGAGAARSLLPDAGGPAARGRLLALVDPAADVTDTPMAAALVDRSDHSTALVGALGVDPMWRCPALVVRLLTAVADELRAAGWRQLAVVATDDPPGTEALLSGLGFRPTEAAMWALEL